MKRVLNRNAIAAHRQPRKRSSKFIGVSAVVLKNGTVKHRARITQRRRCYHIGMYDTEEEAGHAYDKEAKRRFGEHAVTNFP